MKFLAIAAAALPMTTMARVIATPGLPGINATIDIDGDGDADITALGLDKAINVVEVVFDLISEGKLHLVDDTLTCDGSGNSTTTATALTKRAKVPFLHCGYGRAAACAFSASSVVATCFWAAIGKGKDVKEDSKCAGAFTAMGANLPTDCKKCLGIDY